SSASSPTSSLCSESSPNNPSTPSSSGSHSPNSSTASLINPSHISAFFTIKAPMPPSANATNSSQDSHTRPTASVTLCFCRSPSCSLGSACLLLPSTHEINACKSRSIALTRDPTSALNDAVYLRSSLTIRR